MNTPLFSFCLAAVLLFPTGPTPLRAEDDPAAMKEADSEVETLLLRGRSQYLAGDPEEAARTFRRVLAQAPNNPTAREFLARIEREWRAEGRVDREQTRATLLQNVEQSWVKPEQRSERGLAAPDKRAVSLLEQKLDRIIVPAISFTKVDLVRAVEALGAAAEEFDGAATKGVNLVLIDPSGRAPLVTLTLKNLPLRRVLDILTASIGYQYEVGPDTIIIRPGGDTAAVETAIFPLSRATVVRMTGFAAVDNRPASRAGVGATTSETGVAKEGGLMKTFLQQAGVPFDSIQGAALAYDGSAIIVTQTPRNLERVRNILVRYTEVRQVEIEAKFMEVQEGALEELGVSWSVNQRAGSGLRGVATSQNRTLYGAFNNSVTNQQGRIVRPATPDTIIGADVDGAPIIAPGLEALDLPIINNTPRIPGMVDLAATAGPLLSLTGLVGEVDVNAIVRALSQKQGTDLLSAPKVTVLSGNPATMTVAQEMRYPQSFGQTQSQVGTGNANGGGSAGVAITAGTPQEFATRNVGVELRVTPTVEEDGRSISLDLNPRVTEFDGFVEYGGPSVAISGSTTVTVPSGFYQPIFRSGIFRPRSRSGMARP